MAAAESINQQGRGRKTRNAFLGMCLRLGFWFFGTIGISFAFSSRRKQSRTEPIFIKVAAGPVCLRR